MKEAYEFLSKGGILMIPILLCSVIALAIFLERLWALQRPNVIPTRFLKLVMELLERREFEQAQALCKGNDSSLAAVVGSGLRHAGKGRSLIKEVMEETGRRETAYLERGVGVLGLIASVAPLLGLLGTVTGMIRVFQRVVNQVEASGGAQVNAGALANGIWEALITTAAGLSVAIPVFVMFKFLTSRVDGLLVEMEERSLEMAELMVGGLDAVPTPAPKAAEPQEASE